MDKLAAYALQVDQELQRAYEAQKFGSSKRRLDLEDMYKPLVDLLDETKKKEEEPERLIEFTDPYDELENHFSLVPKEEDPNSLEIPLDADFLTNSFSGLRLLKRGRQPALAIGNTLVNVAGKLLALPHKTYELTVGLKELLTKEDPDPLLITENDAKTYREIVEATNSHRVDYQAQNSLKRQGTLNYQKYIKPWALKKAKTGSGLFRQKTVTNAPLEYVYYNTVEELLDRLVLLWGEIRSGNTSPHLKNEICNILAEFKEEDERV